MGRYRERVIPRIINVACGTKTAQPLRRRVCEGLAGDVVEIGFGSGHNIPFYPAAVTRVAAVDPAEVGWKLADRRLRATSVPVQWSGLDGQWGHSCGSVAGACESEGARGDQVAVVESLQTN
jgi:hypothetical protein